MNNQVQQYFANLEQRNLDKKNGFILLDGKNTTMKTDKANKIVQFIFDKIPVYTKWGRIENEVFGAASAKMYAELGLPTPPIALTKHSDNTFIGLASQDVLSITDPKIQKECGAELADIEIIQAEKTPFFKRHLAANELIERVNKWHPLYCDEFKEMLLQFMTEECYEQLISLHLIDELRTDNDRHWGNFFFYKSKDSDKYEGIIVIDVDNGIIVCPNHNPFPISFQAFLRLQYPSWSCDQTLDQAKNHRRRMRDLKKIIAEDKVLTPAQVDIIRKALNYDLPGEIKALGRAHKIQPRIQFTYDNVAALWDYNREEFKELGI